mmetsp:Transcript_2976/g.9803  ORF Transcript_2976/g.9803 Transcript_2976/m.9803 type:complete len:211 (+) Transcript_2976:768-1400(+)
MKYIFTLNAFARHFVSSRLVSAPYTRASLPGSFKSLPSRASSPRRRLRPPPRRRPPLLLLIRGGGIIAAASEHLLRVEEHRLHRGHEARQSRQIAREVHAHHVERDRGPLAHALVQHRDLRIPLREVRQNRSIRARLHAGSHRVASGAVPLLYRVLVHVVLEGRLVDEDRGVRRQARERLARTRVAAVDEFPPGDDVGSLFGGGVFALYY